MKLKAFNKETHKFYESIELEGLLSYLFLEPLPNAEAYREIKKDYKNIIWLKYSGWKDSDDREIYEEDKLELINSYNDRIEVICKYGSVNRELISLDESINECEINGFYFKLCNTNICTFPIIKNYLKVHDCKIMKIIGSSLIN
jgi:hypothetical protein